MPRNATGTREKLLHAGEHLFARKGVDGALTSQIVSFAGQANDSAVQYHFGSRHGLLTAILDKHMRRMEETRKPALAELAADGTTLADVVAAVVEPVAAELSTTDGRNFLRIIEALAGRAGVRTHSLPDPLRDTALAGQLELLEVRCAEWLSRAVARERIAMTISMITATLADRARRIDDRLPVLLDQAAFVANLVAMLTAALAAPDPDQGGTACDRP